MEDRTSYPFFQRVILKDVIILTNAGTDAASASSKFRPHYIRTVCLLGWFVIVSTLRIEKKNEIIKEVIILLIIYYIQFRLETEGILLILRKQSILHLATFAVQFFEFLSHYVRKRVKFTYVNKKWKCMLSGTWAQKLNLAQLLRLRRATFHTFPLILALKFYTHTHLKITRHWKSSTFMSLCVSEWLLSRVPCSRREQYHTETSPVHLVVTKLRKK